MDKEKQIEEMAKAMCGAVTYNVCSPKLNCTTCVYWQSAENAYNAGYRKQSDTVREFVQKLKAEDERCRKLYSVGAGIGFTTISKIAKEYGVGDKQ